MTQWIYRHEETYRYHGMMGEDEGLDTRGLHVWAIITAQTTPTSSSCIVECTRYDTTYSYKKHWLDDGYDRDTVFDRSIVNFPIVVSKDEITICWHWTIAIDKRDSVALSRLPRDKDSPVVNTEWAKARFQNGRGLVEYSYYCLWSSWSWNRQLTLISGPAQ